MNAHIHPHPRLSETLASLSLAPAPSGNIPSGDAKKRSLLWPAAFGLACCAIAAFHVARQDGVALPEWLTARPDAASPEATASTPANPVKQPLPPPPVAAGVTGSGHVVALAQAAVYPRRGGTVVEVAADVGARVEAGQVLLRLDDPDLSFALRSAELARDRARLVLQARTLDEDDARSTARRMAALASGGAVNGQASRDAETAALRAANLARQAEGDLAEAELAVARGRQAVAELTVRAPIGGVVTAREARTGEAILAQVDARGDAPLFTITDPARLALDVDIAETALAAVRPGQGGQAVLDAFPDRPFAVTVQRIAPVASAERGTVSLRLSIADPPPGIRPAMAARLAILPQDPITTANSMDTDR